MYSEEELRAFIKQGLFDWGKFISKDQNLSEEFIQEFKDKVNWEYISKHQKLSENFIKEFKDMVYWYYISIYQKLSENFIKEFQNKVDWISISQCQNLSEDFIKEFKNKINFVHLRWNVIIEVSDKFTIEFDKELESSGNWKINNQFHRILGPAKIWNNRKEYWYRGKQVFVKSDEEYFEWLKVKNF